MNPDQIINIIKLIIPLVDPKGAQAILAILNGLQQAYDDYLAGKPAVLGPVTADLFGSKDQLTVTVQKAA